MTRVEYQQLSTAIKNPAAIIPTCVTYYTRQMQSSPFLRKAVMLLVELLARLPVIIIFRVLYIPFSLLMKILIFVFDIVAWQVAALAVLQLQIAVLGGLRVVICWFIYPVVMPALKAKEQ